MKNKVKKIGVVLIIIFLTVLNFVPRKSEKILQKDNLVNSKKTLSMMLETGAGTGEYEATTRSTWPTDGYVFNSSLSKCENGGKLSWDSETENVIMISDTSDKCYVYFDVYNSVIISEVNLLSTSNSITVSVSATSGTSSISKYYYSKDNGLSYEESTESEYTFSNLTRGTNYKIKVYVKDSNEVSSKIVSKEIETKNIVLLADYIKSLYTTQGANGMYLHNSSLANSANDGSYRYAGANPNNYVCFGTDAESCPTDNLYRIIGVFGDKVKLIKYDYATSSLLGTTWAYSKAIGDTYYTTNDYKGENDYSEIGAYKWNYYTKTNTWSESGLNTGNLNTIFITNIGNNWAEKIAITTTWQVGGNNYNNIYGVNAYQTYQNEIVNPNTSIYHTAKVGLMYMSDYCYSLRSEYWTTNNNSYSIAENWMHMGIMEWTITPVTGSSSSTKVFRIGITGDTLSSYAYVDSAAMGVRPVFYLNSNVTYSSGTGEKNSPIRIN